MPAINRRGTSVATAKAPDHHPPGIAPYCGGWRVYVTMGGVFLLGTPRKGVRP
jgi:hypothetical protein